MRMEIVDGVSAFPPSSSSLSQWKIVYGLHMGFLSRISPFRHKKAKGISSDQLSKTDDPLRELRALQARQGRISAPHDQVSKELREMSSKFSVLSELDQRSLPPISHPIHKIARCPSEPCLNSSANERKRAYTVKVIERTRSAKPSGSPVPTTSFDLLDCSARMVPADRPIDFTEFSSTKLQMPEASGTQFPGPVSSNDLTTGAPELAITMDNGENDAKPRLSRCSSTFLQLYEDFSLISLIAMYDDEGRPTTPAFESALETAQLLRLPEGEGNELSVGLTCPILPYDEGFVEEPSARQTTENQLDLSSLIVERKDAEIAVTSEQISDNPALRRKRSSLRLLLTGNQETIPTKEEAETSGDVIDWMEKQLRQSDIERVPPTPQLTFSDPASPASFDTVSDHTELLHENLSLEAVSSAFCTPASAPRKAFDLPAYQWDPDSSPAISAPGSGSASASDWQSRRASQIFHFITRACSQSHTPATEGQGLRLVGSPSPLRAPIVVDGVDTTPSPAHSHPGSALAETNVDSSPFAAHAGSGEVNLLCSPLEEVGIQRSKPRRSSGGSFRLFHLPGRPKYRERQLEKLLHSLKEEVNATPISPLIPTAMDTASTSASPIIRREESEPNPPASHLHATATQLPLRKVIPRKPIKYDTVSDAQFQEQEKKRKGETMPLVIHGKPLPTSRPLRTINPNVVPSGSVHQQDMNMKLNDKDNSKGKGKMPTSHSAPLAPAPAPGTSKPPKPSPFIGSKVNLSAENVAFLPQNTERREVTPSKAIRSRSMIARLKNAGSRNRARL